MPVNPAHRNEPDLRDLSDQMKIMQKTLARIERHQEEMEEDLQELCFAVKEAFDEDSEEGEEGEVLEVPEFVAGKPRGK